MSPVKLYTCEQCEALFGSPLGLKFHFRAAHLGNVSCGQCGTEFVKDSLRQREQLTNGRKSVLQQAFTSSSHLRRPAQFVAPETCASCRMCRRQSGTIHSRQQHEKQDHHFTATKRAQMSAGFSSDSILYYKSPKQLKEFIETSLPPVPKALRSACESEMEAVICAIRECFPLPVSRLTKGGSYVKGTDTQDWSDIDLVLFSDAFGSLEDCKRNLTEVLKELEKRLKRSSLTNRIMMERRTAFSLRFQFNCYKNTHIHHFDVMPCYDALGLHPSKGSKNSLYYKLYHCIDSEEVQLYAMCLLQYQVDFVKISTPSVKTLIRLVKHWLQTSFAISTDDNKFRRLPSSYTLELISIYVWQLAGKPIFFSLHQGFRAVLKLLTHYSDICIIWYEQYSSNLRFLKKTNHLQTRPFILDPANPTFNVCENSNAWDEVAHVARLSLIKPLFNGVPAKEPWLFTNHW
ncbi:2'-5'-oligoadenylate synthase 1A-like [Lissotriton helveticus]